MLEPQLFMNDFQVLQPFVSRFESLRVQLHNEAFRQTGTEIFDQEGIPHTGRSSPEFAKKLVRRFVAQAKKYNQKKYVIYELGCGNGWLGLMFLNILKRNYPKIYTKTCLYLVDNSKLITEQLKKSDLFSGHLKHFAVLCEDVLKLKFNSKPFFVYFVNLLDSLPCRHIRVDNNEAFEIKISTFQKSGKIQETTGLVPIDEITNIDQIELDKLKKYLSTLPKNRTYVFNYSYASGCLLQSILQNLVDHGLLMISDFGVGTTVNKNYALWSEYGKTIFFSVDFDYIKYMANVCGAKFRISHSHPQEPHEIWLER